MLWPEPLNWWAYQQHLLSFRAANYKKKRCHLHTLGFQLQDKQIERLFNYRQNRSGPRIYPCGTPVGNFRKWILLLCFINIEHSHCLTVQRTGTRLLMVNLPTRADSGTSASSSSWCQCVCSCGKNTQTSRFTMQYFIFDVVIAPSLSHSLSLTGQC